MIHDGAIHDGAIHGVVGHGEAIHDGARRGGAMHGGVRHGGSSAPTCEGPSFVRFRRHSHSSSTRIAPSEPTHHSLNDNVRLILCTVTYAC